MEHAYPNDTALPRADRRVAQAIVRQALRRFTRPRPTGSKVHADSPMYVGHEGDWWQPTNSRTVKLRLAAAEKFERRTRVLARQGGDRRRSGQLGHVGINVMRALAFMMNYATGELFPTIATIAERAGHSIGATCSALKRLAHHGFIAWKRRIEPTGERGLRGPQVRQASNAYRITTPPELEAEVIAPLPEDDAQRRQEARQQHEQMLADQKAIEDAMPPLDALRAILGAEMLDTPLGRSLGALARGFEQRDSDHGNESSPGYL